MSTRSAAILIAAGFLLVALPAAGETKTRGWNGSGSGGAPTMQSLVPRLEDDESYSERYTYEVQFDEGGSAKFEFTISNYGWGNLHGVAYVRVRVPGRERYEFRKKVGRDAWSYGRERFQLTIADTSAEGVDASTFRLTHRGDVEVDLTFDNILPMWSPGRGKITSGGKYFTQELISPRADVEGTVEYADETVEVRGSGTGYADHSATQFAPYDLARRFSRFHDFNDDVFVAWREVAVTDDRGGGSYAWVVVGYKEEIVFSDPSATVDFREMSLDAETGYRIPKRIVVTGRDGKDSIRLTIRAGEPRRRSLLERFGGMVRTLAKAVTDPYQYEFDGEYTLRMTIEGATATVRGETEFSMDILN